jgi:murein DD-endopeptidase MepM/ murein hydrolase activator NlpD
VTLVFLINVVNTLKLQRASLIIALVVMVACVRGGDPAPVVDQGRRWAGYGIETQEFQLNPAEPIKVQEIVTVETGVRTLVGVHKVTRGDTVYDIARRYSVMTRAIITTNSLRPPYTLSVGQVLVVPAPDVHRVAAGETIYGISRHYGVDMATLVRFNGMAAPYLIGPGQELALPGEGIISARSENAVAGKEAPVPAVPPRNRKGSTAEKNIGSKRVAEGKPTLRPTGFPPSSGGNRQFIQPVEGRILSSFGAKGDGQHNDGINISAPRGTSVRAAQAGVVSYAGSEIRGYGNLLLLKHDDGFMTAYAHAEELLVKRGDVVHQGQIISTVGNSGAASIPQLHFEIRHGTKAVDPNIYLAFLGG